MENIFSVKDCSDNCRYTSYCRSFSYRYGGSSDENCVLSDLEATYLDNKRDLILDSNWDVYKQNCGGGGGGGIIGDGDY